MVSGFSPSSRWQEHGGFGGFLSGFAAKMTATSLLHESMKHPIKRQSTLTRERYSFNRWRAHFGRILINLNSAIESFAFRGKC